MKAILQLIKDEPVAFQAIIQSGLAMVMAFGMNMTAEQMAAILVFTAAVLAFFTRKSVTPNHVVAEKVETALNTPVPPKSDDSPMDQLK